jgi:predicted dehydrogenase
MLRVGLIGCGNIGNVHSRALWALRKTGISDATVVAVSDPDAARGAKLAEPNHADVLAPDALMNAVDVVYVCAPTVHHREIVEAAVERGLSVYCEKPLARNLVEAEQVAAMLEKVPHAVGLVLRQVPIFQVMAEAVASGRFGRTMTVLLRDDQYFPIRGVYMTPWRADVDVAGGGTLIEHSIHDIDVFRWFCGDPVEVSCRTSSFFGHPGIEDAAIATFAFDGGATANLVSIWHDVTTRGSIRRIEIFCERAHLWTDNDKAGPVHVETSEGAEVVWGDAPAWWDEIPVPKEFRIALGQYAEASRQFLAGVEAGAISAPGAAEALAAHRLVDGAYRSAASGGAVVSLRT